MTEATAREATAKAMQVPDPAAMLEVNALSAGYQVYRGFNHVLDGLQLHVRRGEKIGLVGESGCGKTTTMKAILRMLPSNGRTTGGQILFEDRDLLKMGHREIRGLRGRRVTAIFQNPGAALNPVFTVGQQLDAVIRVNSPALSRQERRERAIKALEAVSLPDPARLLNNFPVQLSGGMKQRVCIALALIPQADLIIADEPGTALDVTIEDQIMRLFMGLVDERQCATIFISHSLGVVKQWMDRVYVMYAGSIVETAPTEELFKNPLHPYTRALLQAVPKLSGGGIPKGIDGRVPDYIDPPAGCRFHPRCSHREEVKVAKQGDVCAARKPELIDVGNQHKVACFLY